MKGKKSWIWPTESRATLHVIAERLGMTIQRHSDSSNNVNVIKFRIRRHLNATEKLHGIADSEKTDE